ncbi:hypothetical protein J2S21_002964 [Peribacillus cavernae]|nr:hypothetical protein [Peribacillus cavernae]
MNKYQTETRFSLITIQWEVKESANYFSGCIIGLRVAKLSQGIRKVVTSNSEGIANMEFASF